MSVPNRVLIAVLAVTGAGSSQVQDPLLSTVEPRVKATQPMIDPANMRVPLHTRASNAELGEYGLWASGPNFKASFHDGFAFYRYLGSAYPKNLPIHWRTEAIARGTTQHVLPLKAPAPSYTDWRCEIELGGVKEVYDIRAEGVEQSFVFAQAPAGSGDLVIAGRLETELLAAAVPDAHQAITFTDSAGNELVRYGAATAFDAVGNRVAMTTSYDGQHIRLTVPGWWLSQAVYPIIVDPLTSAVGMMSNPLTFRASDSAHDAESHELMVLVSYDVSAGDTDMSAFLYRNDLTNGRATVFADLSVTRTIFGQCCFVGGADRWALVVQNATTSILSVYLHPRATYTVNTGRLMTVAKRTLESDREPTIGGSFHTSSGTKAVLAWTRDIADTTSNSFVYATVIDTLTTTSIPLTAQFQVAAIGNVDQEHPSVNRCSETGDWIVVWQEFDNTVPGIGDDWDVQAAVILSNSTVFQRFPLTDSATTTHKIRPKIEGNNGRYFYSYTDKPRDGRNTNVFGNRIVVEQFDWTGTLTRRSGPVVLKSATTLTLSTPETSRGIGYDRATVSHAVIAFSTGMVQEMWRVGINAIAVEAHVSGGSSTAGPSVVYNPDFASFFVSTFPMTASQSHMFGRYFYYDGSCSQYANGCFGTVACTNGNLPPHLSGPHRGSSAFALRLTSTLPNRPHVPVLSAGPGNLPLGVCILSLDPARLLVLPSVSSGSTGTINYPITIPETVAGDVYVQWLRVLNGQIETSPAQLLRVR